MVASNMVLWSDLLRRLMILIGEWWYSLHKMWWCRLYSAHTVMVQTVHCIHFDGTDCTVHTLWWYRLYNAHNVMVQTVQCTHCDGTDCTVHTLWWYRLYSAHTVMVQAVQCTHCDGTDCTVHTLWCYVFNMQPIPPQCLQAAPPFTSRNHKPSMYITPQNHNNGSHV